MYPDRTHSVKPSKDQPPHLWLEGLSTVPVPNTTTSYSGAISSMTRGFWPVSKKIMRTKSLQGRSGQLSQLSREKRSDFSLNAAMSPKSLQQKRA